MVKPKRFNNKFHSRKKIERLENDREEGLGGGYQSRPSKKKKK